MSCRTYHFGDSLDIQLPGPTSLSSETDRTMFLLKSNKFVPAARKFQERTVERLSLTPQNSMKSMDKSEYSTSYL